MAFACLIRSSCACARVGARLAPTLASPATAVPVKAPPDAVRKSRRDRSMAIPQGRPFRRPLRAAGDDADGFPQECASQPSLDPGAHIQFGWSGMMRGYEAFA